MTTSSVLIETHNQTLREKAADRTMMLDRRRQGRQHYLLVLLPLALLIRGCTARTWLDVLDPAEVIAAAARADPYRVADVALEADPFYFPHDHPAPARSPSIPPSNAPSHITESPTDTPPTGSPTSPGKRRSSMKNECSYVSLRSFLYRANTYIALLHHLDISSHATVGQHAYEWWL